MRSNSIRLFALLFIIGALIQIGVSFLTKTDPAIKPVPIEIDFKSPVDTQSQGERIDTVELNKILKDVK